MKKLLIIFFINIFAVNSAYSVEEVLTSLKEGGKIIFIRHALAPGNGDPENFDLNDCSTQRNLNQRGIEQSKFIGSIFNKNQIKIENVYSSEWCRCIDTAKFAFKNYETFSALNSFYDIRFEANEERQITQLKEFINQWNGKENIIFVTHFVVISSMLNIGTSSGEIVITDKNLNIIGSIFLILSDISLKICELLTCFLLFFPSAIVGISITSLTIPSSKKQIDPDIPGSIPIISIN